VSKKEILTDPKYQHTIAFDQRRVGSRN